MPERLQKFLASAGVASRRKAEELITAGRVKVNGSEVQATTASSATGWSATLLPTHEHWTFLRIPLVSGSNAIALEEFVGDDCTTISAWIWATKPGGGPAIQAALPEHSEQYGHQHDRDPGQES